MRSRALTLTLTISLALNILFGLVISHAILSGSPFLLPAGTLQEKGRADLQPCNDRSLPGEVYHAAENGSSPVPLSGKGYGIRKAVLEGPAVVTTTDFVRRGPFAYERTIQTGEMLSISVEVVPGAGRLLVNTTPYMGIVFQDAAHTAVPVAGERTGRDLPHYDIIFSIASEGQVPAVEGQSAGARMTLLVESALEEKTPNPPVTITGTISPGGEIGAIGGIIEKATAARDSGKTLLLLPRENARLAKLSKRSRTIGGLHFIEQVPEYVDTKEYIEETLGIRVTYVKTVEEAERYMFP